MQGNVLIQSPSVRCSSARSQGACFSHTIHAPRRIHAFVSRPTEVASFIAIEKPCRSLIIANAAKGFGAPKKKVDASMDPTLPCPCGSGQTHEACCQPFIQKKSKASSPEQLLRSRYTAYAIKNADYIADTTHVESQEYTGSRTSYLQSVRQTQRRADWLSLTIEKQMPGKASNEALIQFRAAYVDKDDKTGKRQERPEVSRFWKDNKGTWYYMGSELPEEAPAATGGILPNIQLPSFKL